MIYPYMSNPAEVSGVFVFKPALNTGVILANHVRFDVIFVSLDARPSGSSGDPNLSV